jgi:hypothetical protein
VAVKWYFALSESSIDLHDRDWRGLVFAAVRSAQLNTTLEPHLLYDGQENAFISALRSMGVRIILHRVSFYDALAEYSVNKDCWYLPVAAGAFLRLDIPIIEAKEQLVLYTDCDVIFRREPNFFRHEPPAYFGATSQTATERHEDMNSGVMLINVPHMRTDHPELTKFVRNNLHLGLDQEILRSFYGNRYDPIDRSLNWKPYWGVNSKAQIVHWHGPKPVWVQKRLADPALDGADSWKVLFNKNPAGYAHYLSEWIQYSAEVDSSRRAVMANRRPSRVLSLQVPWRKRWKKGWK